MSKGRGLIDCKWQNERNGPRLEHSLKAQNKQEHEQDEADETENFCRIEMNSCSLAKKQMKRKKGLTNNLES
jgi:hypothetical protein